MASEKWQSIKVLRLDGGYAIEIRAVDASEKLGAAYEAGRVLRHGVIR